MNKLLYIGLGLGVVSIFTFFGYWAFLWLYIGQGFLNSVWYSFVIWSIMWIISLGLITIGFLWE